MINDNLSKILFSMSDSSRKNRMLKLSAIMPELKKESAADQHGIFQHFQSGVTEYATRERYLSQRGGETAERPLYNVGPEHEDSYVPTEHVAPHLSTRYSPDHVGVQAQRVSDGVYKDPYTNKIYDYNEGFKTDSGVDFPAGSASLQSQMMTMASYDAAIVKRALKRVSGSDVSRLIEIIGAK